MARTIATLLLLTAFSTLTHALPRFPAIVIRAHPIVWESVQTNGMVGPNETITCSISLQNLGDLFAPNVTAELLAQDGITPISTEQVYGTMLISNQPVTRDFTFTVAGPAPRVAQAMLSIKSDGVEIGRNTFDVGVGDSVFTFDNLNHRFVPADRTNGWGVADEYPTTIPVSGLPGSVTEVRVTLHNLSHDFPEDLNIVLVSPGGTNVMLMSDCGGFFAVSNAFLAFDSRLTNYLVTQGEIPSGTYSATDHNFPNTMEPPSPVPPAGSQLGLFRRTDPNGDWKLYLYDARFADGGFLRGGWSLTLFVQRPPSLSVRNNGDGRVRVTLSNSGNRTFLLDYSTNATHWQQLGQLPASTTPVSIFDTIGTGSRFYRARRTGP